MKSFTDIEQSKKLVEILPIESADMFYTSLNSDYPWVWIDKHLMEVGDIPCWSLAALLQLFPHDDTHGVELNNYCGANDRVWFVRGNYEFTFIRIKDELIDGLVELILELKEKNLL